MKKSGIAILCALFLLTCDKDTEYQFKDFQSQMVVNGFISPQEGIQVQVSRVIPPNQDVPKSKIWLNDAIVNLYKNDQLMMKIPLKKEGLYAAPLNNLDPNEAVLYHLEVEQAEFGEASSTAIRVPLPPVVIKSTLESSPNLSINGDPQVRWQLRMQDVAREGGAYLAVINIVSKRNNYSEPPPNAKLLNTKIGQFCELIYTSDYSLLFKNECIQGQELELSFEFDIPNRIGSIGQSYTPDLIECKIYTVDRYFYEYHQTLNRPEDFELAFSDPEPLFTNMKGSYGVFLAYNYAGYSFPIPK